MPKVTRKDAAQPLQELKPAEMDAEDTAPVSAEAPATDAKIPKFPPASSYELNGQVVQFRRLPVPQHRMTPLKNSWLALYKPITENLGLDMRMNLKSRKVGLYRRHGVHGRALCTIGRVCYGDTLGGDCR